MPVDFHVIVNPQIELLSPADVSFFEGCLSVPRLMAAVARSRLVRVTCLDQRAEPRVIEAEGWYARIMQHEIDHLQGCLYTDVMRGETLTTVENYQRYRIGAPERGELGFGEQWKLYARLNSPPEMKKTSSQIP